MSNPKQSIIIIVSFLLGGLTVGAGVLWLVEKRLKQHKKTLTYRATPPSKRRSIRVIRTKAVVQSPVRTMPPSSRPTTTWKPPLSPEQKAERTRRWKALGERMLGAKEGFITRLNLLRVNDVQRILKRKEALRVDFLQGISRGTYYDALHFRPKIATGTNSGFFGLGVQVWWNQDLTPVRQRWNRYRKRYPHTKPSSQKASINTIQFQKKQIRYILTYQPSHHALIRMSCHRDFCSKTQLVTLSLYLKTRIILAQN